MIDPNYDFERLSNIFATSLEEMEDDRIDNVQNHHLHGTVSTPMTRHAS